MPSQRCRPVLLARALPDQPRKGIQRGCPGPQDPESAQGPASPVQLLPGKYQQAPLVLVTSAGTVQSRRLSLAATQGNPADFFQHPAPLGSNLYDRDRLRAQIPAGRGVALSDQDAQAEAAAALAAAEAQEAAADKRQEGASQVGSAGTAAACWPVGRRLPGCCRGQQKEVEALG